MEERKECEQGVGRHTVMMRHENNKEMPMRRGRAHEKANKKNISP